MGWRASEQGRLESLTIIPFYAQRIVRYAVARKRGTSPHTVVVGRSNGVQIARQSYRLPLATGRTVLDLYNPAARSAAVTLVAWRTGGSVGSSSTTRLRLAAGSSVRVNVGVRRITRVVTRRVVGRDRKGHRVVRLVRTRTVVTVPLPGRGPLAVTVSAAPLVVEVEVEVEPQA